MEVKMHADRKKIVFTNLYEIIYDKNDWEVWDIFDFKNLYKDSNGYYIILKDKIDNSNFSSQNKTKVENLYAICNKNTNFKFTFSGDADYNLKNLGNEKETHSFYNFSLLPRRGGINTRKGAKYGFNEQFGVFLNSIKDYYKIECNIQKKKYIKDKLLHFGRLKEEYRDLVLEFYIAYFDLFENFYDYCLKVHLIDKKMADNILNKEVTKEEKTKKIVYDYWNYKKGKIEQIYKEKNKKDLIECLSWDLGLDSYT